MPRLNQLQDFETRIWKYIKVAPSGCWLWTGYIRKDGYCNLSMSSDGVKTTCLAHVKVYEFYIGSIPEGLYLDHLCRVRHCVYPRHLEPVTFTENILRGYSPGANFARRTNCAKGHLLDRDNEKICMKCRKEYLKEYRKNH